MTLLNQTQLASIMRCSRASIIAWTKQGLPVVQQAGRGRPKLYDFDTAREWCARNGAGYTRQASVARIRRAELLAPPAPRPDFWTLARAIALARLAWLEDLRSWDFEIPPRDMCDLVGLYIAQLETALESAGYPGVRDALNPTGSETAWPETLEECIARARREVPA